MSINEIAEGGVGGGNDEGAQKAPQRTMLERELTLMKQRLKEMEQQLAQMEQRTPSKYPDVKFLNYHSRKRILITGGAGFVGSHLVDSLMVAGHEVIVADNFFTGRKRNVEHWLGHENFELIHHDIVNALFIEVDEIYHLASPASPPHYMENPVKTIKTNTLGERKKKKQNASFLTSVLQQAVAFAYLSDYCVCNREIKHFACLIYSTVSLSLSAIYLFLNRPPLVHNRLYPVLITRVPQCQLSE